MGIDNSARLVFGIILDMKDFEKIVRKYMPGDYNDHFIFYFQENEDMLTKDYRGIYIDTAYPAYDVDSENWTYYLGIGKRGEDSLTIGETYDLLEIYQNSETDFARILSDFGIKFREPTLMAIPHIN
jgi:hypothetical protein